MMKYLSSETKQSASTVPYQKPLFTSLRDLSHKSPNALQRICYALHLRLIFSHLLPMTVILPWKVQRKLSKVGQPPHSHKARSHHLSAGPDQQLLLPCTAPLQFQRCLRLASRLATFLQRARRPPPARRQRTKVFKWFQKCEQELRIWNKNCRLVSLDFVWVALPTAQIRTMVQALQRREFLLGHLLRLHTHQARHQLPRQAGRVSFRGTALSRSIALTMKLRRARDH